MDPSFQSLSPVAFLERSARVWAERPAVREGDLTVDYRGLLDRVERQAGVLRARGVRPGDRVALLLPNRSAALEGHFAIPGIGAVLVPLNTRLASEDYAYVLDHCGAAALVADTSLRDVAEQALAAIGDLPTLWTGPGGDYEAELAAARPRPLERPSAEGDLISINYTSGTTGRPKGVMTTHRGAYLHALGVLAEAGLTARSRYLWTLPIFHCNGWAYTWSVTAAGGTHLCLPQVDPEEIWRLLLEEGTTHLCAAPTVLTMMLESDLAARCPEPVKVLVGGAPPSPALLDRAAALNLDVIHVYGLTETYGPFAICAWQPDWDRRSPSEQAQLRARQGVSMLVSERMRVVDEEMRDVPTDGATLGEVVMRGNNVMTGYYRDPGATASAFAGGWFHSGDLAVMHPDGYVELRDRLKDVIISGGENIASIEVEQALSAHPAVAEVAVVGAPHERWGETPVAFVRLVPGQEAGEDELRQSAAERLARFKLPSRVVLLNDLPRTSTGKIKKYLLRERACEELSSES